MYLVFFIRMRGVESHYTLEILISLIQTLMRTNIPHTNINVRQTFLT